ncbi:MAG: ABC transporter substrate-binding protein, partial [Chloroflexia bacterium]|nr:ABC transporter substrate-binding protein [Chloroflexia bacterium]
MRGVTRRQTLQGLAALGALALPGRRAAARQPEPLAVDLVRFAWGTDVGSPTPFQVSTAGPAGAVLLSLVYDTLTWKDGEGIIPWLATEWEASDDGLAYTFRLVDGAAWHDGQPLTAADVAFSFDYYAQHPYRWLSTAIVERVTVAAPNQVVVRLKQPYAPFLEEIAGLVPIVPAHVWSKVADPTTYEGADASLGSGPYKL